MGVVSLAAVGWVVPPAIVVNQVRSAADRCDPIGEHGLVGKAQPAPVKREPPGLF